MSMNTLEILLVEDNPGDVRLTMEALKDVGIPYHLNIVRDGVEALEFLRSEGKHSNVPRPDVVLLDLNLPRKTGHQVLAEIRADDSLKTIPVVMLTISRAEEDILKAYNLEVNSYINKPINLEQFTHVLQSIREHGINFVERTQL